jgi:hypothetical protein
MARNAKKRMERVDAARRACVRVGRRGSRDMMVEGGREECRGRMMSRRTLYSFGKAMSCCHVGPRPRQLHVIPPRLALKTAHRCSSFLFQILPRSKPPVMSSYVQSVEYGAALVAACRQ